MKLKSNIFVWIVGLFLPVYFTETYGEISINKIVESRKISQYEWLSVKLDLLALKMSYPAYRVDLRISSDTKIEFTFNLSAAMAEHFTETLQKSKAEEAMSYHAEGLSRAVSELLKNEFPDIAVDFVVTNDMYGRFVGPGNKNEPKPREIGLWYNNNFEWAR